jgi:hypothetical protein
MRQMFRRPLVARGFHHSVRQPGPVGVDTLVQRGIHRIILAALVATSIPGPSRPAR